MSDPSITRDDVRGRSRVDQLSLTDPQEALRVARAIRHPWYRCQSLSKVAEHWGSKQQRLDVLGEALDAAQEQREINRIVTVSAWPVRVMAGVASDVVATHLSRLVNQANGEAHTLRRADALYALASAVRDNPSLLALVMPSLTRALLGGHGWRIDRLIRCTVEMAKASMPELLVELIEHHSEGRKKQALVVSMQDAGHVV